MPQESLLSLSLGDIEIAQFCLSLVLDLFINLNTRLAWCSHTKIDINTPLFTPHSPLTLPKASTLQRAEYIKHRTVVGHF